MGARSGRKWRISAGRSARPDRSNDGTSVFGKCRPQKTARGGQTMTGHIRQRSPGSFEIRYSLGADPATGRRRIATATVCGTRKDAEKELRRLLRALDTGEHVDPNRISVRDWLSSWLTAVRSEVAPKTHERYGEIVNHFLAPALGNLPLAKLAPVHLQEAYNGLATGGRRDGKEGGL